MDLPDYLSIFLRGFVIGLSIAAPVGPIGVLCIRRTIIQGWAAGFLSGLGAATADAIYGSLAAFSLVVVSSFLMDQQLWLRLGGGVFLIYLGVRIFTSRLDPTVTQMGESRQQNLWIAFGSTFLLTLSNPLTILSYVGVFAGLGLGESLGDFRLGGWMVAGVFSGSAIWWLLLSVTFTRLRNVIQTNLGKALNRISGLILAVFGVVILIGIFSAEDRVIQSSLEVNQSALAPQVEITGFTRANPDRKLVFPEDFGAHPDFQTEWWYFTGNLADPSGRRFGYQLTFFRRALQAPEFRRLRSSGWSAEQIYLAHFAITDAASKEHWSFERLSRGAVGLAGAQSAPFEVWLEDWGVRETAPNRFQLTAAALLKDGAWLRLNLDLQDVKGPILQGKDGYSQKGPDPGNASYYYSRTRLESRGQLTISGQRFDVQGSSWMDHEFSTSALASDQVGWDWFSIQLEDQTELMVFQIRKLDGSIDPYSSGAWIASDGKLVRLSKDDFSILVLDFWQSPLSGGNYPSRWQITVPQLGLTLELTPLVADQEMDLSYLYWEGAVKIQGSRLGIPVAGYGYVELTGYADSLAGEF